MIIIDYFYWWYLSGFLRLLKYFKAFILILADNFSIRIILRTFFQPWKKDITPTEGLSLDKRFQMWIWNLISRCFGMVVKGLTFFVFLVVFFIFLLIEILLIIIWLLYPIIILGGIGYLIYYLSR